MRATRRRPRAHDPTLITNAPTAAARVRGDEIVTQHADDQQDGARRRRGINGAPGLKGPVHVSRAPGAKDLRRGKPMPWPARRHDADYRLLAPDHAAYRGGVPDDLLAYTVPRRWRVPRLMPRSLVKSLAAHHRPSVTTVYRPSRPTVPTALGSRQVLAGRHARGHGQPPLGARVGGRARRWQRQAILHDHPKAVFGRRRAVVPRRRAQGCERGGATATGEVHQRCTRADLHRPGWRAQPLGGKRLAARQRTPLVVGRPCPDDMHRHYSSGHQATASLTGARLAIERRTRRSERGRWNSAPVGNSLAAYPTTCPVLRGGGGGNVVSVRDTMRLTVMGQMAKGFPQRIDAGDGEDPYALRDPIKKGLERTRWYLCHGNVFRALQEIGAITMDLDAAGAETMDATVRKLLKTVEEFQTYIENNAGFIPNYGERWRYGERISTGFVESTVNQLISQRMVKKQQMRWSPRGAHLLLQVRTRVLNEELRSTFGRWYAEFDIGSRNQEAPQAA